MERAPLKKGVIVILQAALAVGVLVNATILPGASFQLVTAAVAS